MRDASPQRVVLLALLAGAACSPAQLGLPRTAVSATSPDGRFVAFVKNHLTLDPPAQSLWLRATDGEAVRLRVLEEDADWCGTVVWSADGSTVAFLVQDARLIAADAASATIISDQWLVDSHGEYPPALMAVDLSLSPDGREARFRPCRRLRDDAAPSGGPIECTETSTVTIREKARRHGTEGLSLASARRASRPRTTR